MLLCNCTLTIMSNTEREKMSFTFCYNKKHYRSTMKHKYNIENEKLSFMKNQLFVGLHISIPLSLNVHYFLQLYHKMIFPQWHCLLEVKQSAHTNIAIAYLSLVVVLYI